MHGTDLGVVELGGTLASAFVVTDSASSPTDPAVLPAYRLYGSDGTLMNSGTGSLAKVDTGVITDASNASPIVITSTNHGLQTGTPVVIAGVAGNTAANGTYRVTRVSANQFSLDGTAGNGPYTAGGTWHVSGLYLITFSVAGGLGYEAGKTYQALINWRIGSVDYAAACPFRVV